MYLTALTGKGKRRFSPRSAISDSRFTWHFGDQRWSPKNYSRRYRGSVSLRSALALSLNAASARLARSVGLGPIRDMARDLGFQSELPLYPSLSLGAAEVTPFEVAAAFGTLANQGIRVSPGSVKAIMNLSGEVVARKTLDFEQVVSPKNAYAITNMMETVINRGTARRARRQGFTRPAAGKTGTTNDFGDAWFVGYTPDLLAVVWVGFDKRESLRLAGGQAALPIWTAFMKQAMADRPHRKFSRPPKDPPKRIPEFIPQPIYVQPFRPQSGVNYPVQRGVLSNQPSPFPASPDARRFSPPVQSNGHVR